MQQTPGQSAPIPREVVPKDLTAPTLPTAENPVSNLTVETPLPTVEAPQAVRSPEAQVQPEAVLATPPVISKPVEVTVPVATQPETPNEAQKTAVAHKVVYSGETNHLPAANIMADEISKLTSIS